MDSNCSQFHLYFPFFGRDFLGASLTGGLLIGENAGREFLSSSDNNLLKRPLLEERTSDLEGDLTGDFKGETFTGDLTREVFLELFLEEGERKDSDSEEEEEEEIETLGFRAILLEEILFDLISGW